MKKFILVIPARYASQRLPGKPLVDILGKSMIQRVYEQCIKAVPKELVYIATDDKRIEDEATKFGAQTLMTSDQCLTGTDRVAEVMELVDAEYYINVQGDEPLFDPEDIRKIIHALDDYNGEILNGYSSIEEESQFFSSSIPKVVFRSDRRLLFMSRGPIPNNKKKIFVKGWRQICIYAFPKNALKDFAGQSSKTPLEQEEDIEILRFLELGYDVRMLELSNNSIAVDLPEDLERVIQKIKNETK